MAKRGTAAKQAGSTLERYRAKRDFTRTPEPPGGKVTPETSVFVVQKHAARRLHYDLRLQFGATLKSWAVPQGPSLDPAIRRLAVHTEDHPLEYADFEERIPQGQYGAGGMIVWDRGTWIPMGDPEADYRKGTLKFRLSGEKLGGGWMLVRLKPKEGERGDNWLLIKERDPFARPGSDAAILEERPESVLSGRLVEELAAPEAPPEPAPARKPRPVRPSALQGARKAPLPRTFRPQLASPAARPPEGEEWLHEIKFDGYRTIARIDGDEVRLCTRTGLDWTERYGVLVEAFRRLPCKQALIDGEIVVQNEQGIASFAALQDALAEGRTQALIFFAFDLMYLDGYDLTATPLLERKRALHALLDAGDHRELRPADQRARAGPRPRLPRAGRAARPRGRDLQARECALRADAHANLAQEQMPAERRFPDRRLQPVRCGGRHRRAPAGRGRRRRAALCRPGRHRLLDDRDEEPRRPARGAAGQEGERDAAA